ncbi:family 16 glycosylhydrolase [Leeuwenhoekiella sp. A2]|uniref:family 16 glycosylhydrolase n=1 Tax=Leeuwenhoekiella sp. A2 TaxID=3141460 RepID=UPI003A8127DC
MNTIKKMIYVMFAIVVISCQDDDQTFGEITAPANLTVTATVANVSDDNPYGDGSGMVTFSASADNATGYKYLFGDNSTMMSTGNAEHVFAQPGVNSYVVTVITSGAGGSQTTATTEVTVFSAFDDPATKQLLTGGASKTWYVAAALPAHLGVGPVGTGTPDYYAAAPFEKEGEGCFYNDAITFSLNAANNIVFNYDNQGASFFNVDFLSVGGGGGDADQCLGYDVSGDKFVNLAPATNSVYAEGATTGTQIIIADGGFMSYYIGTGTYEVVEIQDDYMMLRAIPGSNPDLAWYLKFTTDPAGGGGGGNSGGNMLTSEFEDLAWSDEFDGDSLDTSIWNYEIGNNNGWGNQELQYYTDTNAEVSDGTLKITATKEATNGFDYSSARINTKDNYEFKYGRVDVRAKLPEGGGTWPAIWMLGGNYTEVGWPATGEVDIMEYKGNEPDIVHGTLHYPDHSGGNGDTSSTTIENASGEFHTYTVEWTAEHILFAIDGEIFKEFTNSPAVPFNHTFFMILNVAMGGTFGGAVDPAFQQSAMEVDYVRVYQ